MEMAISVNRNGADQTQAQPGSIPAPSSQTSPATAPVEASGTTNLGGALSDKATDSLFAGVHALEKSGASTEQVKSFVDNELHANGIDTSAGGQRSGQLVDMMS